MGIWVCEDKLLANPKPTLQSGKFPGGIKMRKLKLSKETLHSLDGEALREAQGGFITVGAFTVCFVGCIIMPK